MVFHSGISRPAQANRSVMMRIAGARRIDVGAARDVLLQDVVLDGAGEFADDPRPGAAPPARRSASRIAAVELMVIDVETCPQRDALEQALHVGQRGDRHADAAHFARGQRMVGIHAHLRGQIEGHRESGGALREQIAVAAVALLGGAEAGVLAHGPEAAAVHVAVDAARVGELARVYQEDRS